MANELVGKYKRTVLICGSAPSLLKDYEIARNARPVAQIIAINDAASVIVANFLATLHPEKAKEFVSRSLAKSICVISGQIFHPDYAVHSWFDDCNSGATTAGGAIKMAAKMGFDEIILCGCPMEGGDGYFDAPFKKNKFGMATRFGNAEKGSNVVTQHQENLKREFAEGFGMVKSMSGFTRRFFGAPKFLKEEA